MNSVWLVCDVTVVLLTVDPKATGGRQVILKLSGLLLTPCVHPKVASVVSTVMTNTSVKESGGPEIRKMVSDDSSAAIENENFQ